VVDTDLDSELAAAVAFGRSLNPYGNTCPGFHPGAFSFLGIAQEQLGTRVGPNGRAELTEREKGGAQSMSSAQGGRRSSRTAPAGVSDQSAAARASHEQIGLPLFADLGAPSQRTVAPINASSQAFPRRDHGLSRCCARRRSDRLAAVTDT
jgi:hypothetical protein